MPAAQPETYLQDLVGVLNTHWPDNRTVHIVCHGHSVPAGYFATPVVDTFSAYPHLLHRGLKHRFPCAVVNVIVTAIGGENAETGAARFAREVLEHRPDVVTIDYGLNDRGLGLLRARECWVRMIEAAHDRGVRVLLLTPTADATQRALVPSEQRQPLQDHAGQIRELAAAWGTGLVDSLAAFEAYAQAHDLGDLLSWSNHPNRKGHELVARALLRWFPVG
jgi:acyl-CoA thioesterase I